MSVENLGRNSEIRKNPFYKSFVNSRRARPALALVLFLGLGGVGVTSTGVLAHEGSGATKPEPAATWCLPVLTRAKNVKTGITRCFADNCFDKDEWEEEPSDSSCDEPTTYKNFITNINKEHMEFDPGFHVGPQPNPTRTIVPIEN